MSLPRNPLTRVVIAALALCALSFAVGVAGDLSLASQPHGARVSVVIPPDAVRARPLPPLPRTASAEAAEIQRPARLVRAIAPQQKPRAPVVKGAVKLQPDQAPKPIRSK